MRILRKLNFLNITFAKIFKTQQKLPQDKAVI